MSFFQRPAFRNGIPLLIFIIGGSFALEIVTGIRYRLKERSDNFGLSSEAKRALARKDYSSDSYSESPSKEIKPKLSEATNADEFVREAFKEFVKEVNRPQKQLDKNDPEYQRMMEKLKKVTGKKFSLEDAYNQIRESDITSWENKRVPRPYSEQDETDETES